MWCAANPTLRRVKDGSGAKLTRPELFRFLADSEPGDVLLIEQVDRLAHLTAADLPVLRAGIDTRRVRIVAFDLPMSWSLATAEDDFTGRMPAAVDVQKHKPSRSVAVLVNLHRFRRLPE